MIASFLDGAAAMACLAVGAFFVRFWRESADRLSACLATAFWIFAVNYAVLGLLPFADERRAYAFALRLVGFVAILVGVVSKSRELTEHLRVDQRGQAD
jgi:uncharacterized protein (TIGR04206 family)